MTSRSVVLAAPVRTAIGTFGGSLKDDTGARSGRRRDRRRRRARLPRRTRSAPS